MFPGPSADAWDEACVTLTYRGPSPGQARMGATGATWKEDIDDLVKGGERMQMMSWIFWILNTFWTALDFFVICNLCKLYAAIAARVIGYDVPWCAMKIIINHEHQDVFFFLKQMFFSNPSQAMTFPSCRGSAYVTAELRGLKPFISSDLPLAVAAPRNRQKQKHHSCVTFKSLSAKCHLLVTCWSLAGNFEGALKVTDQTLILRKEESSSLV